ncbi:MAG: pitrilysin family protein [Anaerolineae bacterium]
MPFPTLARPNLADQYNLTRLPNGLRIITVPLPDRYSVTAAFYVGVGARYEPAEVSGISHFIEHMAFKGTQRYPTPAAIGQAIEGVGGALDAFTSDDRTGYIARVPAARLPVAIDLVADMLRRPKLRAADVAREKRVILEELAMIQDEPESWVAVLGDELMFGAHPLGRDILGTEPSLRAMTRTKLVEHVRRFYRPGNTVIALAGAFDADNALTRIAAALGDWEPAPSPGFAPAPALPIGPLVRVETRAIEQAHLRLSVPGFSLLDPRRHALQLLGAVLGAGMSSRLFLELREHQALAYNVYSDESYLHDTGILSVYTAVDPRRAPDALRTILRELRRLRDEPVPDDELQRTKEYLNGGLLLRLEDTAEIAMSLAGQAVVRDEILTASDMAARLARVTAEDIQATARLLLARETMYLALVGPFSGAERFEGILAEAAGDTPGASNPPPS